MTLLFNSAKVCVWVYSDSEVRLALKTKQAAAFVGLNKLMDSYPPDTRQAQGDEPQFRLPISKLSSRFYDELTGLLGAQVMRSIRDWHLGSPKKSNAPQPSPARI